MLSTKPSICSNSGRSKTVARKVGAAMLRARQHLKDHGEHWTSSWRRSVAAFAPPSCHHDARRHRRAHRGRVGLNQSIGDPFADHDRPSRHPRAAWHGHQPARAGLASGSRRPASRWLRRRCSDRHERSARRALSAHDRSRRRRLLADLRRGDASCPPSRRRRPGRGERRSRRVRFAGAARNSLSRHCPPP